MYDEIPADWRVALAEAIAAPSFHNLSSFVATERQRPDTAVFPPEGEVFAALKLTPLGSVRAAILGQDPYHGDGQADGLAFSCRKTPWPPSLRNIIDEWQSDLGRSERPTSGSLEPWARNGVLLLNTILTVRRSEPRSHEKHGWEEFTRAVLNAVKAKPEPVAFLLWGRKAQRLIGQVPDPHVTVIAAHPSPYSVRGFRDQRPFSTANRELERRGVDPIDWGLSVG